jgi:serine/threonine protein kinase
MNDPCFAEISTQGKDLMQQMIIKNPEHRPSADEILKHDWFKIRDSTISNVPFLAA